MRRLPGVVAVCGVLVVRALQAQAPPARICTGHSPGLSIPDANPAGVDDDLVVGLNGHLADLDLELHVTHTYVGDLKVRLTHLATGTNELLLDLPGAPATPLGCSENDIDAILDDQGKDGATIDHGAENECDTPTALHGHLVPGDPPNNILLGAFQGEKLAGTWRLSISDNAGGDTGTLDQWCLLPALQEPGPEACTWQTPAAFPSNVVRALAVYFPDDGKVYLLGGRTDDSSGSDILHPHEYDPAGNSWTQKSATFADAAVDNMVGGVLEALGARTIFMVGGSAAAAVTAVGTVRQYAPAIDSLSEVSSDPWPGAGTDVLPGGAAVVDDKLYVFGGYKINSNMVNTIWEFDPGQSAGNRWKQMNSVVPSAEGYIPTAVANGYVYLLGGANYIANVITETNNVYRFDPRADTIVTLAPKPGRPVAETQAVTEHDGTIWVFSGGRDANQGNPAAQVNIYHPGTDTWTVGPPIAVGRRNGAVAADPSSGRIWAVGGYQTISNFPTPIALHDALVCPLLLDGFERGSAVDWTAVVP